MGLPNIEITFRARANTAMQRLLRGTVGIILKDEFENGACELSRAQQAAELLPKLGADNLDHIKRAFIGNVSAPRRVVAYVLPATAADYAEALGYMATQRIDYLVGPPDIDGAGAEELAGWIKAMRSQGATPKAVLPNEAADDLAIINFTTEEITAGGRIYTTAEYCSRIAGLIAGTPPTMSCTHAPLPEVERVKELGRAAMDAAVDAGQFIIYSDGTKVKAGRGVNSLVNAAQAEGLNDSFKKIKVVEIMDMIKDDIRAAAEDSYIGKYPNSYDNKCLLIAAIGNYLTALEKDGLLQTGGSSVGIDIEAQVRYLESQGRDTEGMSEQDIKEANTGPMVLLAATASIIDAIEDIILAMSM